MTVAIRSARYEIRGRVGAGGMGVVYRAWDRDREVEVALKTLAKTRPSDVARLKREFRALADVVHPNLVTLYELTADDEQVFFTMELVDGEHLDRWVRPGIARAAPASQPETRVENPRMRIEADPETEETVASSARSAGEGGLDVTRLRAALPQLAEGIHALHVRGLLHRDLKPSNIKVTPDGRVVVLDFGLVTDLIDERSLSADERPLEGTVAFMSPEQGARLALSPASDWYGLGVVLYACLIGRPPFIGAREEVLMDKQRYEPPPPHELEPSVPRDLSELTAELLRRDPERRPSGLEVLRRLGSGAVTELSVGTSLRSSATDSDRSIGRDRELVRLANSLARTVRGGRPILVELEGRSGVGKSHVLRAFVSAAAGDGAVVLRGRCYETESVPFKAVDGLIDALAGHLGRLSPLDVEGLMPRDALALARLFPVLRQIEAFTDPRRRVSSPDPQEVRRRGFAAFSELLARLADRGPLVLAVDDLQWGDVDSATLLASLFRAPEPPPLLLVTAFRSEDRGDSACLAALREQTRELGDERISIELGPLDPVSARELALLHLAGVPGADGLAGRIADESQGVPFFVEELARQLRERPGDPRSTSLAELLRARLRRLPDAAAALLSVLCVAARPVPRALAERAANVRDPSALPLLLAGSLARSRAVGGQRRVEPYHDRVRETAVELLGEADRRAIHLRLARAYEATPQPDSEALAYHYGAAGVTDRAAEFARQAADQAAAALAFDRAARLYRTAIDGSGDTSMELLVPLADALANAGRGLEAAEAYLAAAADAPVVDALDLRIRASEELLWSGHVDRGLDQLQAVLGEVGMALSATERRALASLIWSRLQLGVRGLRFRDKDEREIPASQLRRIDVTFAVAVGLGMADVTRAAEFHSRHLLMALRAGEPKRIARGLGTEAVFQSYRGWSFKGKSDRVLALMAELVDRTDDPRLRALYHGSRGLALFNYGQWQAALDELRVSERVYREQVIGHRYELATATLFANAALAISGRVREMVRDYPGIMREARQRGDLYTDTSLRAFLGFYPPLIRDDPVAAIAEVEQAIAQWTTRGYHLQHINAVHSLARIELYRGRPEVAERRLRQEWPAMKRSHLLSGQLVRTLILGAWGKAAAGAYRAGDRDPALLSRARRCARRMHRENVDYCTTYAHTIDAEVALAVGDRERCVDLLAITEAAAEACGLELNVACLQLARGALIGGDEGAALAASAEAYFAREGLVNPTACARVFAPDVWSGGT